MVRVGAQRHRGKNRQLIHPPHVEYKKSYSGIAVCSVRAAIRPGVCVWTSKKAAFSFWATPVWKNHRLVGGSLAPLTGTLIEKYTFSGVL